jgi:hypothetical protein
LNDGVLGLVLKTERTMSELEKKRLAKTAREHELKKERQQSFETYKKRFESILRAQTRLNLDPDRVECKRTIMEKAKEALNLKRSKIQ